MVPCMGFPDKGSAGDADVRSEPGAHGQLIPGQTPIFRIDKIVAVEGLASFQRAGDIVVSGLNPVSTIGGGIAMESCRAFIHYGFIQMPNRLEWGGPGRTVGSVLP